MSESTDETVGTLEGEVAVDRVILQDEVKLFRVQTVLAYLDSPVYDFAPTSIRFGKDPVPVFSADGKQIGFASVRMESNGGWARLAADLTIDYASEERLLVETQSAKIYPFTFGGMSFPVMPLFDFNQRLAPTKLIIDGIVLKQAQPYDERIVPLGQPVI